MKPDILMCTSTLITRLTIRPFSPALAPPLFQMQRRILHGHTLIYTLQMPESHGHVCVSEQSKRVHPQRYFGILVTILQ